MINRIFQALPVILLCLAAAYGFGYAQGPQTPQSREQVQLSFAPLVREVSPAVVNIYTKKLVNQRMRHPFLDDPFFAPFFQNNQPGNRMRKQVENSLGSGVILKPDGLIITNSHVIRGADEITVGLSDGREFPARLALQDDASDITVLRVDTKGEELPFVDLKPSESLEVGDLVLAIGNPFGVGQTVTSGIISAKGRSSLDISDYNFFIQTDAAINPGNSGGPLVDLSGDVVGINTAIYSRSGGSLGIGFAVPSEMVMSVLAAEAAGRTGTQGVQRAWLGVSVQSVTPDIAQSLGLDKPAGVLVADLHSASPLAEAGIKQGDIITAIAGYEIRDANEMKFRTATIALGQKAEFSVMNKDGQKKVQVTAVSPPETPARNETLIGGRNPLSGVKIANINPALVVELGIEDAASGVVVVDVTNNGSAGRLFAPGDILIEINGRKIKSVEDVKQGASEATAQGWVMIFSRGGQVRQMVLR